MTVRYKVVCHTCEVDEIHESFERAQEFFTEHAADDCEVVLERAGSQEYPVVDERQPADTDATDSRSTVD